MRLLLRSRRRTLLLCVLVATGFSGVAAAYLTAPGAGSASVTVGSINPPSGVVSQQTAADITISWDAATLSDGGAVDGYRVTRSDGPTVCGSPTLVSGLSCTDTDVPAGTYAYTVIAVYRSWTAAATGSSSATLAAPAITSNRSNASADPAPSLSFGSGENACRLDGGAFASCTSPHALSGLADGSHTFKVHATQGDSTGPDATYTWTIDTSAPAITATPGNPSADSGPSFSFEHSQASYTFTCQLDGAAYGVCTSPRAYGGPYISSPFSWTASPGNPSGYVVSAADAVGNTGQAPLTFVDDSTAPTAGALTANATVATSAGPMSSRTDASFSISARTDFAETMSAGQSGLQSGALTVQSATLVDTWLGGTHSFACGVLGSGGPFTSPTSVTGTTQPSGIVTGACYTYTLTGTDDVGTSAAISTTVQLRSTYLYWANNSMGSIGSANLDAFANTQSFISPAAGAVGVAVDATHIFWTDIGGNRLGRANRNGSNPEPDFMTGVVNPAGLAVSDTHIYWSSRNTMNIGRALLDGTGVPVQNFVTGATGPAGVAVDAGHIYWSNQSANTIGRADLNGGSPNQSFVTGAGSPYQLVVGR